MTPAPEPALSHQKTHELFRTSENHMQMQGMIFIEILFHGLSFIRVGRIYAMLDAEREGEELLKISSTRSARYKFLLFCRRWRNYFSAQREIVRFMKQSVPMLIFLAVSRQKPERDLPLRHLK